MVGRRAEVVSELEGPNGEIDVRLSERMGSFMLTSPLAPL